MRAVATAAGFGLLACEVLSTAPSRPHHARVMELAAGRSVKESSSGRGGGDSESGRYRSERDRVAGAGGGARDYAREGGGRSGERDRERDRRGGEKQRRKGSSDSRGGGGGGRHYSDSRQDRGYRYSGHRDRSSRWEFFLSRFERAQQAVSCPPSPSSLVPLFRKFCREHQQWWA